MLRGEAKVVAVMIDKIVARYGLDDEQEANFRGACATMAECRGRKRVHIVDVKTAHALTLQLQPDGTVQK